MATIKDIAERVGMDEESVRRILLEDPTMSVERDVKDKIYATARKMGYDLTKLRFGKKLADRSDVLRRVIEQVEENTEWGRDEILVHLRYVLDLTKRHHKRSMPTDIAEEGQEK
ncbi:MAG: hypothetical protein ACYS8W_17015 [Planctomycetota bacterium]